MQVAARIAQTNQGQTSAFTAYLDHNGFSLLIQAALRQCGSPLRIPCVDSRIEL